MQLDLKCLPDTKGTHWLFEDFRRRKDIARFSLRTFPCFYSQEKTFCFTHNRIHRNEVLASCYFSLIMLACEGRVCVCLLRVRC